jgi:protein O-mannosyl-transferase
VAARRVYAAVAACAVVVYLGALWNHFALDDNQIIAFNGLVHHISGMWRTFVAPYWPPDVGGGLYRPLAIASYTLDWTVSGGAPWWFHAVNLAWHAGASVAVALLAKHLSGDRAAWTAGLLFAVHPVHVEAVANVVGRAEIMAALFVVLAVYAALARDQLWWSLAALACGVLSKENAIVAPGLIVWAWVLGLARPSRERVAAYAVSWLAFGVVYLTFHAAVLNQGLADSPAPVFVGASPIAVRLTAVATLADVARLLVFPLTLRVDYSPAERSLVTTPFDLSFMLGFLSLGAWVALIWLSWRRGRRVEAFGLGWIGIAFFPVSNLMTPVRILLGERNLYLPSVGLALAVGAWLQQLELFPRRLAWVLGLLVVAGGARTAMRVPVWKDSREVTISELEDSPRSFLGHAHTVVFLLTAHQPAKALEAFRTSIGIFDVTLPWLYVSGAEAAWATGQPALADSILTRLELVCRPCDFYYQYEASIARARGYTAAADSFVARIGRSRAR